MDFFNELKGGRIKSLKKEYSIPDNFVTILSNMLNREFYDSLFEDNYILVTKDKIVAISNHDIFLFGTKNQRKAEINELETRNNFIGLGKTWVKKDIFRNVIDALETYNIKYNIYLDPFISYPMLITTAEGNVMIAPLDMKEE